MYVPGSFPTPEQKMAFFLIYKKMKKIISLFWPLIIVGFMTKNKCLKRTNVLNLTVFEIWDTLDSRHAEFGENFKVNFFRLCAADFSQIFTQVYVFWYAESNWMVKNINTLMFKNFIFTPPLFSIIFVSFSSYIAPL